MIRLVVPVCAGLALLAAWTASAQQVPDFRRGLSAYNRGQYAESYRRWQPLADAGDADSAAGLGYLYYKGLGVPQDYGAAADWFRRAAEQGQPEAQLFLGTLFYNGVGVRQSYVQAYKWCDLAQSNGASQAAPCRDAAQQRLTTAELDESSRLVTEWFTRHKQ